jgi:hypothetical protein
VTNQRIVLEHRNGKDRAIASEFDASNHERVALDVGWYRCDVGNLGHLLCASYKPNGRVRGRSEQRVARARSGIGGRRVVGGDHTEDISVAQVQIPEGRFADSDPVLQHGLKHKFHSPGEFEMTRSTSRCRCLLLQGFA